MEYNVKLPLSEEFVRDLKIDDIIYITGTLITARDQVHKLIESYTTIDKELPDYLEKIKGSGLYHCGPLMVKDKDDENTWIIKSAGPTTSARMNPYNEKVCKKLNIGIVIGKGGMVNKGWNNIPAVYCVFPGGVGALATKFVKKIKGVEFLHFGIPEAMWILEVENFGPLLVAIDSNGDSIF